MKKELTHSATLLLLLGLSGTVATITEAQTRYTIVQLAELSGPAPGGGTFVDGFKFGDINNRREMMFGAAVQGAGEGVFAMKKGRSAQIALSGQAAPGGGAFGAGLHGNIASNENGDAAFIFYLEPFSFPIGANAGVYRVSGATGALTPVVAPGVTPAPGGGVFRGAGGFGLSVNNRGDLAFAGIVPTEAGIHLPEEPYLGLGMGIFLADKDGAIAGLVVPGDPAPGGGTFDFVREPWLNDAGDVAFAAHVAGDPCPTSGTPQEIFIFCPENLYVRSAATGAIRLVARLGGPAPGGGIYENLFAPILNNRGDIAFMQSAVSPEGYIVDVGVFLSSGGETIAVARPGDWMPGGGRMVTAGPFILTYDLNERGEVSFDATIDTDDNADGLQDTGLYVWSNRSLHLAARSGTVLSGVGTLAHLMPPSWASPPIIPFSGAKNNERGDLFFQATLTDGRGVLLLASPRP